MKTIIIGADLYTIKLNKWFWIGFTIGLIVCCVVVAPILSPALEPLVDNLSRIVGFEFRLFEYYGDTPLGKGA